MDILKGVRVVDVTQWAFVPACGAVLAHWGADVIKVEPPRVPDPGRRSGLPFGAAPERTANGFFHYNRGKRGITLDLQTDEGREILYKLVEKADVFLTSFLTDTREKLKIDIPDIRAVNPKIIYAKGTGRGPQGPWAERGGYDIASWWGRGSLADTAMRAAGVDFPTGMTGHGDGMSGHTLAGGVCAALFRRERTGVTSVLDASLLGTAIWFNGPAIMNAGTDQAWGGVAPRETRNPIGNNYKTKDGRWITLAMLTGDPDWADLAPHLDLPDLANDSRFAKAADRMKNGRELVGILDKVFATKTLEEWKKALATTRGVWEPIQTVQEIHEDPQTKANKFIRTVEQADGTVTSLAMPAVLFDQDSGELAPAPAWGQHTDEILGELGISTERIAQLREQGVIR